MNFVRPQVPVQPLPHILSRIADGDHLTLRGEY